PDCEGESAEPVISRLGARSLDLWKKHYADAEFSGSLVVAHPRDRSDFERFARTTSNYERLSGEALETIEPALAGRFRDGLFFAREGHVEPRNALPALHEKLRQKGVPIRFNTAAEPKDLNGWVVDCRGLGAREKFSDLRGVKGE